MVTNNVLTSWANNVSGLPFGSEDKIEAAGRWIETAMGRSDDAAIKFAMCVLTGWLDLEMKTHKQAVQSLISDCAIYIAQIE